jgi:hypothetical protein
MAIELKKPAKATVTQQDKVKGQVISEDIKAEKVEQPGANAPVSEPMCEVGLETSYTHNLGDYKSARVSVSLKVPCLHAEIDDVYEYAQKWVESRMNKLVEDLVSQ